MFSFSCDVQAYIMFPRYRTSSRHIKAERPYFSGQEIFKAFFTKNGYCLVNQELFCEVLSKI